MRIFAIIISIVCTLATLSTKVVCENDRYSKSCFVRFFLKTNQIDGKYKKYIDENEAVGDCEKAVKLTLDAIQKSSNEPCIVDLLNKKDVAEVLLRKFLLPQLDSTSNQVVFDEQFTTFRRNVIDVSSVVCNNPRVFKPDVVTLMKEAKSHKESRARELKCLEIYIKKSNNQFLSDECIKIVNRIKSEFFKKMENDLKNAFAPPYDQLYDVECSKEKAEQLKLFERVFFFVVLSTSRDMTDKQINAVAKNANSAINTSGKVFFECMK